MPQNTDVKTVKDSALMRTSFQDTLAVAEIIVPGIRLDATFDSAAKPKTTFDAICNMRKRTLDAPRWLEARPGRCSARFLAASVSTPSA